MNILILDYLSPKNHVALYNNMIQYLTHVGHVKVVAKDNYYLDYKKDWKGVELEEIHIKNAGNNMVTRKLQSLTSMIKTRKIVKNNKDCLKVVLTFDTIAFALGWSWIKSNNIFILHHKNIDELNSKVKKFVFKTYMNKVNHIVFEEFFKEYLINEIGIEEKRVHVIPHPIFSPGASDKDDFRYDCIGLSNSNDEEFIKKIIEEEVKTNYLKNSNLNVVLRSKKYRFDNGNLKVISGYLSKEEYDNYTQKCKSVFVPLPSTFKYRVSGVIYDALSNYKVVIANNVPIVKHYEEKYPDLCIGVNDVRGFFEKLDIIKFNKTVNKDFTEFIKHHDEKMVIKKFRDAFKDAFKDANT
ncbi:glycosyltransferase family 4 protein [Bacillus dicomae]|uniref:Glycosyltransferase family 4 protein n=1 Tax=Bacillus dicomae TaxID=3088378 RepID=A0AC61T272_9BACI|nr:glycosyltransferase family 4 protein [Bacillus dicomae]TPV41406.1 glycosyltransferase family 4 protein [Bacillus dicomae]